MLRGQHGSSWGFPHCMHSANQIERLFISSYCIITSKKMCKIIHLFLRMWYIYIYIYIYTHTHIHTHTDTHIPPHTHTPWNITQPFKKKRNLAICSNLDISSGYYTKWNKSKLNMMWFHSYVEPKETNKTMWKQTQRYREQMDGCQKGGWVGKVRQVKGIRRTNL